MNKDNIGLTLQQRFKLEISDDHIINELENTEYQMNKFSVVKFGANLKKKTKQRDDSKAQQIEKKPTIESKRQKNVFEIEIQKQVPVAFVGEKRSSEQVERTVSQNSREGSLAVVDEEQAQFSPVRPPALEVKSDIIPATFAQPSSVAQDLEKEQSGHQRDTVIVLDSNDSNIEVSEPSDAFRRRKTASMSTAAKSTVSVSHTVSKSKTSNNTSNQETLKNKDEVVLNSDDDISFHLYETIKCVGCLQPPISPKQCASCQNLTCSLCLEKSNKCISCGSVSFLPIKDKILLKILDKFVLFNHQCCTGEPMKIYSQNEMDLHKNSFTDCASKKYRCFCQGKNESFSMSYIEIFQHLKTDCGKVRIQCHLCQQDQSFEEASFNREEFKAHKCYRDIQLLQEKLKNDEEFMIAQVVQIQNQKQLFL